MGGRRDLEGNCFTPRQEQLDREMREANEENERKECKYAEVIRGREG